MKKLVNVVHGTLNMGMLVTMYFYHSKPKSENIYLFQ